MKKALIFSLFIAVLLITGAGSVTAQQASAAGEWDASMNTPGGARPFKLVLKVDGEKLTGSVKRNDGELPLQGTVKGTDIKFSYTITYNEHDLVLSFTGKIDGDSIRGSVDFGGNGGDEWNAKRVTAKPK